MPSTPSSLLNFVLPLYRRQSAEQQGIHFGHEESCATRPGEAQGHGLPENDAFGLQVCQGNEARAIGHLVNVVVDTILVDSRLSKVLKALT